MARRRRTNTPGLVELAEHVRWQAWAMLAATAAFMGIFIVPFLFAGNPALRSPGLTLGVLCAMLAVIFTYVSLARYLKQLDDDAAAEAAHRHTDMVALRARSGGLPGRKHLRVVGNTWGAAPTDADERPKK